MHAASRHGIPSLTSFSKDDVIEASDRTKCDNVMEARRPDIFAVGKKEHKRIVIDIAVPDDIRIGEKE